MDAAFSEKTLAAKRDSDIAPKSLVRPDFQEATDGKTNEKTSRRNDNRERPGNSCVVFGRIFQFFETTRKELEAMKTLVRAA